jgi:hypothetical protein
VGSSRLNGLVIRGRERCPRIRETFRQLRVVDR